MSAIPIKGESGGNYKVIAEMLLFPQSILRNLLELPSEPLTRCKHFQWDKFTALEWMNDMTFQNSHVDLLVQILPSSIAINFPLETVLNFYAMTVDAFCLFSLYIFPDYVIGTMQLHVYYRFLKS